MAEPTDFLSRKEAAAYLTKIGCPVSFSLLANLASNNNEGDGPPFLRVRSRIVRYERQALETWAYAQTRRIK